MADLLVDLARLGMSGPGSRTWDGLTAARDEGCRKASPNRPMAKVAPQTAEGLARQT